MGALPWREPFADLLAFAESRSAEEFERHRPGINRALRNLRRSVYNLKKPKRGAHGWNGTTRFKDPAFDNALFRLMAALVGNPLIDPETKEDLHRRINRIVEFRASDRD